ncbi:hypothetical protein J8J40_34645, partial [Mycobacterium tuberculosis]|nr:hypothetical protein [Mycobacterium tuberculosis]
YRLFRRDQGGFALYLPSGADLDGTSTALGLIESAGGLPGTAARAGLIGPLAPPPTETVAIASTAEMRLPEGGDRPLY